MPAAAQLPASEAPPQAQNSPLGDFSPAANDNLKEISGLGPESRWGTENLDYMHARYYNPLLGRFLSTDLATGVPELPQSWDRYTYVMSNPMNFTDPDGLRFAPSIPFLIWANAFRIHDTITVVASAWRFAPGPTTGLQGLQDLQLWVATLELHTGADDEFRLNLFERAIVDIPIDGLEFGRCVEQNRFDWGAVTAFTIGNPIANRLAGSTGRMGFGGLGPHPTSWQHKVGASLSRTFRNPVYSRVGKFAGRAALVPTVLEGFYDIGTIGRCAVVTGGN